MCLRFAIPLKAVRFPFFLNAMLKHEPELLAEAAVLEWFAASPAKNLTFLPEGSDVTEAEVSQLKSAEGVAKFIEHLQQQEDDDEEEEEEEA